MIYIYYCIKLIKQNYKKYSLPLILFCESKYSLFLLSNNTNVFENEAFVSIDRFFNISSADMLTFSTSLNYLK